MRIIYLVMALALFSCEESKEKELEVETPKRTVLFDTINGVATEYYPSGKVKIQGELNPKGERNGKWTVYSEDGLELNYTFFRDGLRHGHSFTAYPNGAPFYYGDYENDKMVGEWRTYDTEGKYTIKDYGQPE